MSGIVFNIPPTYQSYFSGKTTATPEEVIRFLSDLPPPDRIANSHLSTLVSLAEDWFYQIYLPLVNGDGNKPIGQVGAGSLWTIENPDATAKRVLKLDKKEVPPKLIQVLQKTVREYCETFGYQDNEYTFEVNMGFDTRMITVDAESVRLLLEKGKTTDRVAKYLAQGIYFTCERSKRMDMVQDLVKEMNFVFGSPVAWLGSIYGFPLMTQSSLEHWAGPVAQEAKKTGQPFWLAGGIVRKGGVIYGGHRFYLDVGNGTKHKEFYKYENHNIAFAWFGDHWEIVGKTGILSLQIAEIFGIDADGEPRWLADSVGNQKLEPKQGTFFSPQMIPDRKSLDRFFQIYVLHHEVLGHEDNEILDLIKDGYSTRLLDTDFGYVVKLALQFYDFYLANIGGFTKQERLDEKNFFAATLLRTALNLYWGKTKSENQDRMTALLDIVCGSGFTF